MCENEALKLRFKTKSFQIEMEKGFLHDGLMLLKTHRH